MRTKDEILSESLSKTNKVPAWDATASLHERLTIEVLLDIRDILTRWASKDLFDKEESP